MIFGETSELAGAEHILARREVNDAVREEFLKAFEEYVNFAISKEMDIFGSQPTAENIAGGLSGFAIFKSATDIIVSDANSRLNIPSPYGMRTRHVNLILAHALSLSFLKLR